MRAAVLVKQVPDLRAGSVAMRPDGTIDRGSAPSIVNPADLHALEAALQLADEVVAISMGPPAAETALRDALAYGAHEAHLVTDRAFAGSDTWATANILAAAIDHLGSFDLVLCGLSAIDGETGQVGPQIAERLDWPQATGCEHLDLDASASHRPPRGRGWLRDRFGAAPGAGDDHRDRLHPALPHAAPPTPGRDRPGRPARRGRPGPGRSTSVGLAASPTKVAHMENVAASVAGHAVGRARSGLRRSRLGPAGSGRGRCAVAERRRPAIAGARAGAGRRRRDRPPDLGRLRAGRRFVGLGLGRAAHPGPGPVPGPRRRGGGLHRRPRHWTGPPTRPPPSAPTWSLVADDERLDPYATLPHARVAGRRAAAPPTRRRAARSDQHRSRPGPTGGGPPRHRPGGRLHRPAHRRLAAARPHLRPACCTRSGPPWGAACWPPASVPRPGRRWPRSGPACSPPPWRRGEPTSSRSSVQLDDADTRLHGPSIGRSGPAMPA